MSFNSPAGTQHIDNTSVAPFAQANWRFSPRLTVTTGARLSIEDRTNRASTFIRDNGFAPELNPVTVNGVSLGGFATTSAGLLAAGNSADQLSLADRAASKQARSRHHGHPRRRLQRVERRSEAATGRRQGDSRGADRHRLRLARRRGLRRSAAVVRRSPLYKLTEQVNTYVSWQYGRRRASRSSSTASRA